MLVKSVRGSLTASLRRRVGASRTARSTEPSCSSASPRAKMAGDCATQRAEELHCSIGHNWRSDQENGRMSQTRFESWHLDLHDLLGLAVPPIAIAFIGHLPAGIGRIERTMTPATTDGRKGPRSASCVFWIEGTQGVFATVAEDHGNCSVGSLTHGFKSVAEIAHNADFAALYEDGWDTP